MDEFQYITSQEAMAITGHKTANGLRLFIRRHNQTYPGRRILARRGRVEKFSLMLALKSMAPGIPIPTESDNLKSLPQIIKKMSEATS